MTGKWSQTGVPHRGWCCIDIDDVGDDFHICQMCEVQPVRYVHTMEHPDYPDTLDVGCVCAGNMEQDYHAARTREARFKQTKKRRQRWLEQHWRTSASGNDYINTKDGFNVVIFRSRGVFWSGRIVHRPSGERMFARHRYRTAEQAKLAAFDGMLEMKHKMNEA